jgi:low affinity Fe/Cu permease
MDWQIVINVGTAVFLALVGNYTRNARQDQLDTHKAHSDLAEEFADFKVKVAETCVTHEHLSKIENGLQRMSQDFREAFLRIEDKLDRKKDKDSFTS